MFYSFELEISDESINKNIDNIVNNIFSELKITPYETNVQKWWSSVKKS